MTGEVGFGRVMRNLREDLLRHEADAETLGRVREELYGGLRELVKSIVDVEARLGLR